MSNFKNFKEGAKGTSDYNEIYYLIGKLKLSVQDNPSAQKLILKLEKKCVQQLGNSQNPKVDKGKNLYTIANLLLQLERIAENHWEDVKEIFRTVDEP